VVGVAEQRLRSPVAPLEHFLDRHADNGGRVQSLRLNFDEYCGRDWRASWYATFLVHPVRPKRAPDKMRGGRTEHSADPSDFSDSVINAWAGLTWRLAFTL
jgi:hypothetical protein